MPDDPQINKGGDVPQPQIVILMEKSNRVNRRTQQTAPTPTPGFKDR